MQYIQYDEEGNITATIIGHMAAPDHPRQLVLEQPAVTSGKKVDLENMVLVDLPDTALTPE